MPRLSALLGVCTLGLLLSGCGATAPSSVTGTWNGTWTDPLAGPAPITITLTQSGTALSGTWSIQFPGAVFAVTGTLTGTLDGTNLAALFTPDNPTACARSVATTVDKTSMKGEYSYTNCAILEQGTITAQEQ